MDMTNFNEGDETGMRQKDTESKALMKSYADVHRKVTKNNIEIGDNVFIHQRKMNKFSTPYSAVPLTVIDKKHSMIAAENAQRKVTRNASFFKRVHPNTAMSDSQNPAPADDVDPLLNVSHPSKAVEDSMGGNTGKTGFTTPRRSGRVISAPKRLIEVYLFIFCLFGVLRRFQHCTGHITTGSWKGRGNQYIEFARVVYCKLPTNGKQLPAFPLTAMTGIVTY